MFHRSHTRTGEGWCYCGEWADDCFFLNVVIPYLYKSEEAAQTAAWNRMLRDM